MEEHERIAVKNALTDLDATALDLNIFTDKVHTIVTSDTLDAADWMEIGHMLVLGRKCRWPAIIERSITTIGHVGRMETGPGRLGSIRAVNETDVIWADRYGHSLPAYCRRSPSTSITPNI